MLKCTDKIQSTSSYSSLATVVLLLGIQTHNSSILTETFIIKQGPEVVEPLTWQLRGHCAVLVEASLPKLFSLHCSLPERRGSPVAPTQSKYKPESVIIVSLKGAE